MGLFSYCGNTEQVGCAVDGVIVMLASLCFNCKITVVTAKLIWTSDDDLTHHDVIIAHFNGQFMVCKVGKY